jgi:uncharacterized protein (TIGR00730 family)
MATLCVFCAASETIAPHYVELAAEVGTELGRRGHDLVTGGGSVSAMGAVSRAARAAGAHTVGVIPEALLAYEVADTGAAELVVTGDMRERKGIMDERSDAFLVLPGGIGTLEELLEIWVARTLGLHDKPLVVVDPDGLFAPLREQGSLLLERGFLRAEALDAVTWVDTAAAAFEALDRIWAAGPPATRRPTTAEVLEAEP